jgi:APA family basic amino acid/polyamine antiporter
MTAPPAGLTVLRSLGFVAMCAIAICNMVGQGVFLKARVMTCNVGSPLTMIAAWIVAGLLALCGALTLAELGAAMPQTGGIYAFLRRAYGGATAFSFGWMMLLVATPASTAALAAGAAIFFNVAAGHVLDGLTLTAAPAGVRFTLSGLQSTAIALIAAVTAVNCAPAAVNGRIAEGFALLKIAMLVAVTGAAFALGHAAGSFAQSGAGGACIGVAPALRGGFAGFAAALVGALYAYSGWQSITLVAGEVQDPGRNFPLAMSTSVIVVIASYVAANAAFVHVLGAPSIASLTPATSVGVRVVEMLFGPVWRTIAAALLFASVAATLHVTMLTGARVVYALAQDGTGFRILGRLSARARVPVRALLANSALAIALVLIGSFDTLSDYLVFNTWVYYIAAGMALFVLRRREAQLARPYRAFGYPFVPAIFVAVGVWLLIQTLASNPRSSLIGLAIVAVSFPVYAVLRRRERSPANSPTGGDP